VEKFLLKLVRQLSLFLHGGEKGEVELEKGEVERLGRGLHHPHPIYARERTAKNLLLLSFSYSLLPFDFNTFISEKTGLAFGVVFVVFSYALF